MSMKLRAHRLGAGAEALRQARLLKRLPVSKKVLKVLVINYIDNEYFCYTTFDHLAKKLQMPRAEIRRIVRHLARRGLALHGKGLHHEDGSFAGSGYAATMLGKVVLEILDEGVTDEQLREEYTTPISERCSAQRRSSNN